MKLVLENSLLYGTKNLAIFKRFYQWVLYKASIISKNNLWFFKNKAIGGSNADIQIKNTQIATFDGASYLSFVDLNGATIVSSEGTSVPSKINDQRINFTAGTCWALTLSNGSVIPLCEGQGVTCYDIKNVNQATVVGATLSVFWGTKSDSAYPYLLSNGYSQYLICETIGTTSHLASPDNSNVGSELVTTGGWTTGTGWTETSLIFDCDGTQIGDSDISKAILTINEFNYIELNLKSYTSGSLTLFTGSGNSQVIDTSFLGKRNIIIETLGSTDLILRADVDFIGSLEFSTKEIQTISAYGEWEFYFNKSTTDMVFNIISLDDLGSVNGRYYIRFDGAGDIELRKDASTFLFYTGSGYINANTNYCLKVSRNSIIDEFVTGGIGTFAVYIKGGSFGSDYVLVDPIGGLGSNPVIDNTYTETKFIVINADPGDELWRMSKDVIRFDPNHFINGTGIFGVQNVINVT